MGYNASSRAHITQVSGTRTKTVTKCSFLEKDSWNCLSLRNKGVDKELLMRHIFEEHKETKDRQLVIFVTISWNIQI